MANETERNMKVAERIKELAAEFLVREGNNTSLITVTSCSTSPDLKRATVYFTVLPITKEKAAFDFVMRKRGELRDFLKKNMPIKTIPFIEVAIDLGEKNRQKIDELLRNG